MASFGEFCKPLVKLHPGQEAVVRVGVDGERIDELPEALRDIAVQIFGAIDDVPDEARGTLVLVKGARIGGSYIFGGLLGLYKALTVDLSGLAPGETAACLSVGPDVRLGRIPTRYSLGAAKTIRAIASRIDNKKSADGFAITRPDGKRVSLEALPSTRGGTAVRGRSLPFAVMTEAAFMRDADYQINGEAVHGALAPRVLPGGMLVIESTPWDESGVLYNLFKENHAAPKAALVALCPTLTMRPEPRMLGLVDIEKRRDPDNAAREYECQFLGSSGTGVFFDAAQIDAAVEAR